MTALLIPAERAALVPEVKPLSRMRLPSVTDRVLANGARVVAARRPAVPRVEVRVVIPTARGGTAAGGATARLLACTLLSGTTTRTATDIAEALQHMGATLDVRADAEDLVVSGSCLTGALDELLALVAEVLTSPTFPADEVALERDRLVQELSLARSQPATIAREALAARLFGSHPYGRGMPSPRAVQRVRPAGLHAMLHERVHPGGAVVVVVGDIRPERVAARVEAALAAWTGAGDAPGLPAPAPIRPGPIVLVDRPGAVQTNIRLAGPAVPRTDPAHPALALANLVYGGYFVSRLVDNIREKRGYTYSPGSGVQHQRQASWFVTQADVATEVTAPALAEIRYELERMASGPISPAELLSAKRYLAGALSMSIQSQAGLAGYLSMLCAAGLPVEYLRDFPARVEALGEGDVIAAARRHLAPRRLVTVLVGDADRVGDEVEAFGDVRVTR